MEPGTKPILRCVGSPSATWASCSWVVRECAHERPPAGPWERVNLVWEVTAGSAGGVWGEAVSGGCQVCAAM